MASSVNSNDIYSNPENDYQRFVNAYKAKNPYFEKKEVVKKASVLWSEIKEDASKVAEYIASAPKRRTVKKQSKLTFATKKNIVDNRPSMEVSEPSGSYHQSNESSACIQQTSYPNGSAILLDNNTFRDEVGRKKVSDFISFVMQDPLLSTKFLTDESIWKEDVFSTTCTSVAQAWGVFNDLRSQYEASSSRSRQSELTKKLEHVVKDECDLKSQITDILAINTSSTLGIDCLVRNANMKKEVVLNITRSLFTLKVKITEKELLNSLRRRIRQIMETKKYLSTTNESVTLICRNDCSLTWGEALDMLTGMENGNSFGDKQNDRKYLTISELIRISNLLKDSSAVSESELLFYIPSRLIKEVDSVLEQLCTHLPVLILRKDKHRYVINMYQLGFDCDELNAIFDIKRKKESVPEPNERDEYSKGKGRSGGRKSILSKFPNIPDIATEFIKSNGFKAQERRRETTITSCGVSVKDIRDHLLKVIPGLSDHGLSENTVRYLFRPVKKGTFAAERYTSVIDAKVPRKDNSDRDDNVNAHYLLSRVKLRRELAAHFPDECLVASADSMNKIKYGALAVSRYHQIRKIYLSDDAPKYMDHDFPLPYKTIPDGIMILSNNKEDDIFVDDDIVLQSERTKVNILSDIEATANSTGNQRERLLNTLFRAAYELDQEQCCIFQCVSLALSKKGFNKVTEESLKCEVIDHITRKDPSLRQELEGTVYSSKLLDLILWTVAEKYDAKIVLYNSITPAPAVVAMNSNPTNVITFASYYLNGGYIFHTVTKVDPGSLKTFGDEEDELDRDKESEENVPVLETDSSKTDKLGRPHISYPHTGPAVIYLRNNYFHANTCLEHVNDLLPIINEGVKRGKTCFILISDGGPDYNPNSYKNEMLYAKLWEKSGLDMLIVTCNAAGWSAMNPIEHLWSPLSSSLTSVKLKCSIRDDGVAPCNDTKLTPEEEISQNKEILEQGARDISAYWSNITFDGHPVVPIPVSCDGRPGDAFQSSSYICDYLTASQKDIKLGKHKDAHKLYKFVAQHADRRKNEIIFSKCQFKDKIPCVFCQANPVKCKKLLTLLKTVKGCMYEPTPSADHEDHYMTFLGMVNAEDKAVFAEPNEHLPSKSIGKCEMCPSWQFSSVTEAKRHVSLIHPVYRKETLPGQDKVFQCKFEKCDMIFASYHKLSKHRKDENHFVRKRLSETSTSSKETIAKKRKTTSEKISTFFSQKRSEVAATVEIHDVDGGQEDAVQEETIQEDDVTEEVQEEEVLDNEEGVEEDVVEHHLESEEIQVSIGEYVSAVYDDQPYIGRVKDIDSDDVHVDFMEPHVKGSAQQTFLWPSRSDEVWVRKRDILCVVSVPEETKRGYKFTPDTCQNICELFWLKVYNK